MSTAKEQSIKTRTIEAAKRYLSRSGYELRSTWDSADQFGLIAKDEGTVTFIRLISNGIEKDSFPDESKVSREDFEQVAIDWFAKHDDADMLDVPVRFDVLSLKVLCEDRALVRHHVNALETCEARDFVMFEKPNTCM